MAVTFLTGLPPQAVSSATALIRSGATRDAVRQSLRRSYGVGFSNSAFTMMRRVALEGAEAGASLTRRRSATLPLATNRAPTVIRRRGREGFRVTGRVTAIDGRGQRTSLPLNVFVGDRPPTRADVLRAAEDVWDRDYYRVDSQFEIQDVEVSDVVRFETAL